MKLSKLIPATITALAAVVLVSHSQEPVVKESEPEKTNLEEPEDKESKKAKTKKFMGTKLVSSQKILAGLVTENFEAIEQGAGEMLKMTHTLGWDLLDEAFYDNYTREFQRITTELKAAAKAKKLDKVTLLYVQMTLTCVDCHVATRPYPTAGVNRSLSDEAGLESLLTSVR